jgi:SAM-dependent methyltransferase
MSFDALAPHYRWMEFILAGKKLQRCRTSFLDQVSDAKSVLIVGEGHGRFLVECRRKMPSAKITVLDASARMLDAARNRLSRHNVPVDGIEFIHSDALKWEAPKMSSDLIATHFFLDCFPREQLGRVILNLANAATPNATWLLSDFQIPADGLGRYRARIIHRLMYLFFRVATKLPARRLVEPDEFLIAQNFVLRERRTSDWGLLRADYWIRRRVES